MGLDKQLALDIVMKRIDVPGALADIVDMVLEPALDEMVADTKNPYDDAAKAAIYPILEKVLKEKSQELWDKLKGDEPE